MKEKTFLLQLIEGYYNELVLSIHRPYVSNCHTQPETKFDLSYSTLRGCLELSSRVFNDVWKVTVKCHRQGWIL